MGNTDNQPPHDEGRKQVSAEHLAVSHEIKKIAHWLKTVHFRKALFGVSQKDVWKKIGQLNDMYMTAVAAERARYDALLEQMQKQYDASLAQIRGQGERRE